MTDKTALGRRDWDYITFADYEKDTKELTLRAMDLVQHYRREIETREDIIYALIKAAGGRIAIGPYDIFGANKAELVVEEDASNNKRIYRIVEKSR